MLQDSQLWFKSRYLSQKMNYIYEWKNSNEGFAAKYFVNYIQTNTQTS
jgi:hypothetical protein